MYQVPAERLKVMPEVFVRFDRVIRSPEFSLVNFTFTGESKVMQKDVEIRVIWLKGFFYKCLRLYLIFVIYFRLDVLFKMIAYVL